MYQNLFYVHYMFPYIYNEHERDSWLILEKTFVHLFKNSGVWQRKWNYGGRGGYTTVYNLMFVPSSNFARHKSDLSPNQTQVDLRFLKDTTRRSCLRLWPQQSTHITIQPVPQPIVSCRKAVSNLITSQWQNGKANCQVIILSIMWDKSNLRQVYCQKTIM